MQSHTLEWKTANNSASTGLRTVDSRARKFYNRLVSNEFWIRPDLRLTFDLPVTLTANEIKRLIAAIETFRLES